MTAMTDVYPLKFNPIYKDKIWGGRNLERLYGRDLPTGELIGESWELADLKQGVSIVSNGPAAGKSLTEITARWGANLLGKTQPLPDGRFPLLLKLLDAGDILSLQVHPDNRAVAEIGGDAALKTECWYVAESRDGYIYKGAKPGVNADEFRAAIESDTCEQVVRRIDVAGGDFHYLPAGTVHAIGPGCLMAEVQTPSDTTYRVTDWGRGREIHVERSMQSIRFELTGDDPPGAGGDTLLTTDYFTVAKLAGSGADSPIPMAMGVCAALMFVGGAGSGKILHDGAVESTLDICPGDTVLLPAGLDNSRVAAPEDWTFLVVTLPPGQ